MWDCDAGYGLQRTPQPVDSTGNLYLAGARLEGGHYFESRRKAREKGEPRPRGGEAWPARGWDVITRMNDGSLHTS